MTGEVMSKVNNTQDFLRSNGEQVSIMDPDFCVTEGGHQTTTVVIDLKVVPSVAFKIVALNILSTHHPKLETFLKALIERYGSSFARVFFKQLRSNEISADIKNHVPASAKYKFKPMLLESIKNSFPKRQNTSRSITMALAGLPLAPSSSNAESWRPC